MQHDPRELRLRDMTYREKVDNHSSVYDPSYHLECLTKIASTNHFNDFSQYNRDRPEPLELM
jgi:hypothetical protein